MILHRRGHQLTVKLTGLRHAEYMGKGSLSTGADRKTMQYEDAPIQAPEVPTRENERTGPVGVEAMVYALALAGLAAVGVPILSVVTYGTRARFEHEPAHPVP